MLKLTIIQQKYLDKIKEIHAQDRRISYTEIARHFGVSIQSAKDCCLALRQKGYIEIKQRVVNTDGVSGFQEITLLDKTLAQSFIERMTGGKHGS